VNDGGPAFPFTPQQLLTGSAGLSVRDYFAGQALAAMTVAPDYSKGPCNSAMAERAFVIADAMLVQRDLTDPDFEVKE